MQYPEPDDGAWPARVLRNRRMNQVPETENPATRLQFMHQRLAEGPKGRFFAFGTVLGGLDDAEAKPSPAVCEG